MKPTAIMTSDPEKEAMLNKTAVSDQGTRPKINGHMMPLDSIRGLAALVVVLCHCSLSLGPLAHGCNWLESAINTLVSFAHDAVDTFIVLSGFCLTLPVLRTGDALQLDVKKFFRRRFRRIVPPYYLAMMVSFGLIFTVLGHKTGTEWDICIPVSFKDILWHVALLQDVISNRVAHTINYSLWSISVEWHIYFLFPLIILGWRRLGALPTTLLSIIGSLVTWMFLYHHFGFEHTLTINYVGLFSIGMLGAKISVEQQAKKTFNASFLAWMVAIVVIFLTYAKIWHHQTLAYAYTDIFVGIWAVIVSINVIEPGKGLIKQILSRGFLPFLGTFAYSIYLIHAPILQMIWLYLLLPLHLRGSAAVLTMTIVGTSASVLISYAFFLACERPFLVNRKNETSVDVSRDAALSPAP